MARTRLQWQGTGINRGRALSVEFTKFGTWDKTTLKLARLDRNIKSSLDWGEKKVADRIVKLAKGHLRNQDLGWDVLSASTIAKKGGDLRILIHTGTYLESIKTWKVKGTRLVGVPFGVTNPLNGEEIWRIAQIHELRSLNGGPERALWNPTYQEMGGGKGIRAIIFEVLYRKLLALGYPVKKQI